jgi:transposase-like protein
MVRILDVTTELSSEEACLEYLERLRWPNGVECVKCGAKKISPISTRGKTGKPRQLYQCLACRSQFTVRTGTIFQDSHLQLNLWFRAVALICRSKKINVTRLKNALNVHYRTASYLLARIQGAIQSGGNLEVRRSASSDLKHRSYG